MEHLAGHPVGELLDHFGIVRKELLLFDEPPGHLKGLAFQVEDGPTRKWVTAIVEQTAAQYDPARAWPEHLIREARVLQIYEGERLF